MGQNTGKISLAELTGRYVGKPWERYSCIKLVHDFYEHLGVDVPDSFGDIRLDDAIDQWRKRPAYAILSMLLLFRKLGQRSSVRDPERFDLLVIRRGGEVFPGVYLGGGKFMTSTLKEGVTVARIGKNNRPVLARRLV